MPTTPRAQPQTFTSTDPATGEVVGTFRVDGPFEVRAAVARAQDAAGWWADVGVDERRRRLLAWKGIIARRLDELAALVHRENGKPVEDALLEAIFTLDHLDWAARKAKRVLGRRILPPTVNTPNQLATLEYVPRGVVGVIGPWNFPIFTPMGSIVYALAAGNAIVYKPSELTPATGRWLADTFAEVVPEQPVFGLVTGAGETGAALVDAGVDKVAFTGSASTGRKVMAACAERLTPLVLELGGNDAMIVDADADLDAAAAAAVFSGLQNAGQACISTERVYAVDPVYDAFVQKVVERVRDVVAGSETGSAYGPMTMPAQLEVVRRHLDDALSRGARALVGGAAAVRPPYVDPVVLVDVPDDALVLTEETFGPLLPICRVRDADEALRLANDSPYGLASMVFGRRRGTEIARGLRAGMTGVNAPMRFVANPALPFGGVGDSGFGRVHGADGLKEFALAKSVTRQVFRLPSVFEPTRFPRHPRAVPTLKALAALRHGRR